MTNYTITEEQIKELSKGNKKVEKMFPYVFKQELKIGYWYRSKINSRVIFFVTSITDEKLYGFGINYRNEWFNNFYDKNSRGCAFNKCLYIEATEQEVKEALTAEAIKRGFKKGAIVKSPEIFGNGSKSNRNKISKCDNFHFDNNRLLIIGGSESGSGYVIFKYGTWAEIVKSKYLTKDHAEKRLTELENDAFEYEIID